MGIRNKLVLCLLAVLFPLAAVGLLATHLVDREIAERTSATLATTERLEAERIEQTLKAYAVHARTLASDTNLRDFITGLHNTRFPDIAVVRDNNDQSRVIGGQDGFAIVDPDAEWPLQQLALSLQRKAGIAGSSIVELRVVDRKGDILGESLGFSWTPVDEKLIDRSMRAIQTYFGDAFVNPDEQQRLGMVSPIIAADDSVVGALVMETRLGPLVTMTSKHENSGRSTEAHIAQRTKEGDAQFITALRFDRKAAFNRVVKAQSNAPIIQALNSAESQVIRAKDYRGVNSLLAFETIKDTKWGLVVKVDTAEVFAPADKLRKWLWWATAASIGFVAIIYLFFLVPIVRRLNKAASAARQITNGNLSSRVIDHSNDEITELTYSINVLARDLEADQKMRCEVEARLLHQAIHDDLTGLFNRKHSNYIIKNLTENETEEHSVVFLDLNGFKDVNDLFGHAAGDEVLICVAQRLSRLVPDDCTLARWGGDEFVVIMPGLNKKQAEKIVSRLQSAFDTPVASSNGHHDISCSFGLATSSNKHTLEDALIIADALMYEQKKHQHYERSKKGVVTRGLERAILEDRMEIWFDPIVRSGRPGNFTLAGAESQIRICNSEGAHIIPDDYITDLDDSSVLRDMDLRALSLSLNSLRRWNMVDVIDTDFKLTLKLSAHTLNFDRFPQLLESQLKELNVAASQLQLELPPNQNGIKEDAIASLQRLGVTIALNGIGIEPNLLRYVPSFQPDTVVIGKPHKDDQLVLPHLVVACKNLHVDVVARSVETRDQLSTLHALGIRQFQGPLFERPVKAVDFVSRWGKIHPAVKSKNSGFKTELLLAS